MDAIKLSLHMSKHDEQLLSKKLGENSDDNIRRKLIEGYNSYYRHW